MSSSNYYRLLSGAMLTRDIDLSNYIMHVHINDKDMFKKIELHVVSDKCVSVHYLLQKFEVIINKSFLCPRRLHVPMIIC